MNTQTDLTTHVSATVAAAIVALYGLVLVVNVFGVNVLA